MGVVICVNVTLLKEGKQEMKYRSTKKERKEQAEKNKQQMIAMLGDEGCQRLIAS